VNARETAFDLLIRWRRSRLFADELLNDRLEHATISAADRALSTELFYGCLRNKLALEYLLSQVAAKKPRSAVAAILMLGLYQIFFLKKIPAHAAVHETVELAKSRHGGTSAAEAGFVNAALRRALTERETLAAKLGATRDCEPWVYYSHPRWLFERWQSRWGKKESLALCEWNNTPPSIYIRTNALKIAGKPADLDAEPTVFHPLAWKVTSSAEIFQTSSWVRSIWSVSASTTCGITVALF